MNTPAFILAILGALWLGAMLPGPSFVIVARSAIGQSRLDGLASALGMGIGGILFASLALAGLYSVLQTVGWLYLGLKLAVPALHVVQDLARREPTFRAAWRRGRAFRQRAQVVLDGPCHSDEQSQDRHLVRQHFRGPVAAAAAGLGVFRRRWCFWSSSAGMPSSRCASRPRGSTCARRNGWTGSPRLAALGLRLILTARKSGL